MGMMMMIDDVQMMINDVMMNANGYVFVTKNNMQLLPTSLVLILFFILYRIICSAVPCRAVPCHPRPAHLLPLSSNCLFFWHSTGIIVVELMLLYCKANNMF